MRTAHATAIRPPAPNDRSSPSGTMLSPAKPTATATPDTRTVRPPCLVAWRAASAGERPSSRASRNRLTMSRP